MRSDLEVWRKGQFQFKQIVSDLLTEVISGAIDRADEYIQKTELLTFNYGELQMHSVLIPSIVDQVDSFILEYPIVRKRGRQNHFGRSDYYCRCNVGQRNEYQLFIELKSGVQGLPCKDIRKQNKLMWETACKQIDGIKAEITRHKAFYDKPVVRVAIESLSLYADESKKITDKEIANVYLKSRDISDIYDPNLIVLWRCDDDIRKLANDEWHEHRKLYGMLFICHIMKPINPR